MTRIKQKDLALFRERLWIQQGRRCALSGYTIALADAVVDHCHKTGEIRGVLHRGVNALLGKIENNHKRYGVAHPMMVAMAANLGQYLSETTTYTGLVYPTHKTEEEKRERRNKLARLRRAKAKKEGTA